jgi:APA family basic amino acid/polyamine antiporter
LSRANQGHLLRVLGLGFGIALGIGSVIGAGILRTPGTVAGHVPLAWLALALWAFAGAHALLTANVVAELMTSLPKSGGLFNVAGRAFGAFGALLVGWTDWLFNVASAAALSVACAEFLAMIFPGLADWVATAAVSIAVTLFVLNWLGVREGSMTQIVVSVAKAVLLVGLIAIIFLFPPAAGAEEARPASGGAFGLLAIVLAYQLITGTYAGWSGPAYFAEEDKAPARNIPRSLFGGLLIVIAIYLAMNAALLFALPLDRLASSELPVALAISDIMGATSMKVVAAIAAVSALGTVNASIMIGTRIFHGLGRDGFLPRAAARVNRGGSPDVAIGVTAVVALGLATSGEFETVFLIAGALSVSILALTDAAYFKLRRTEPDLPRPYRARGHPWLPALALLLDAGVLIAFLLADLRSALFMAAGIAVCIPLSLLASRARRGVDRG